MTMDVGPVLEDKAEEKTARDPETGDGDPELAEPREAVDTVPDTKGTDSPQQELTLLRRNHQ